MSDTCHGLIVLTTSLPSALSSREKLVEQAGGQVLDETENSVTFAYVGEHQQREAIESLVGAGLVHGETVFPLEVPVPQWLPAFRDAAASMVEHGG